MIIINHDIIRHKGINKANYYIPALRGDRSIDVKEKYIKPTRVFELEDGVGIYRNRRR